MNKNFPAATGGTTADCNPYFDGNVHVRALGDILSDDLLYHELGHSLLLPPELPPQQAAQGERWSLIDHLRSEAARARNQLKDVRPPSVNGGDTVGGYVDEGEMESGHDGEFFFDREPTNRPTEADPLTVLRYLRGQRGDDRRDELHD